MSPPGRRRPRGAGSLRIYKTGDISRWLSDGTIEFFGRSDHQVKIRGFRVELEEIERHLAKHEVVKEAVVSVGGGESSSEYLCAYFTFHFSPDQDRAVAVPGQLKSYLAGVLPGYLVPSYFVPLEHIPLTATGKIDRKALPAPEKFRPQSKETYAAPGTSLEETIAEAWQEILKLDAVGVEDNFFDIGGTSLDIIRTGSKLNELLKKDIPIIKLFTYPTIRSLAHHLGQTQTPAKTTEKKIEISSKLNKARDKKKKAAARMRKKN